MSDERAARPITFLVSIAGGRAPAGAFDAIAPALGRLGEWRKVAHPESSLAHHAARVEQDGGRPIHLAIGPVHECYLTPALPTILLPLWDYPEVPGVDLNHNSRMNWVRVANKADLLLAPSKFVVEAFRRSGVTTPAVVAPIPVTGRWRDLPTWGPNLPVSIHIPHVSWCANPDPTRVLAEKAARRVVVPSAAEPPPAPIRPASPRAKVKRRLRRLKPYFSNAAIEKIDGYKNRVLPLVRRPNPVRIAAGTARLGYRHLVRRWIGEGAHARLRGLAHRLRGHRPAPAPRAQPPVTVGPSHLMLSGLVYSATVDYDEPTTDDTTLVHAFLHAFSDRPDVTLLIRLTTTPSREAHDLDRLWHVIHAPRLDPQCRVVIVPGTVGETEDLVLGQATSYHIETGRTKGFSPSLQRALAAGRPAIVPDHSLYAEWVDESVGFRAVAHAEPTAWPMDGLARHATTWNRVSWADLRDRLLESAAIADDDPVRYERLSIAARERVASVAGVSVVVEVIREAIALLPGRPLGAFTWA